MAKPQADIDRIKQELHDAGVTSYGVLKFTQRYLVNVLLPEEHVMGAVYGRYRTGPGWLEFTEGSLIATNLRLMFIDHKPGFTSMDEVSYDVVTGCNYTLAGPFAAITVHTKMGQYALHHARPNCVTRFVRYIEQRRNEMRKGGKTARTLPGTPLPHTMTPEALQFLRSHELGVFGTVTRTGALQGAVVYYMVSPEGWLYIATKEDTAKGRNVTSTPAASFTVYDAETLQTAQMQVSVTPEDDTARRQEVLSAVLRPRKAGEGSYLPPITALAAGEYLVLRLEVTEVAYRDYREMTFKLPGDVAV